MKRTIFTVFRHKENNTSISRIKLRVYDNEHFPQSALPQMTYNLHESKRFPPSALQQMTYNLHESEPFQQSALPQMTHSCKLVSIFQTGITTDDIHCLRFFKLDSCLKYLSRGAGFETLHLSGLC